MDVKVFQDIPAEEREEMLLANADQTEEMPVKKFYEESEIMDMRKHHVNNSLQMKKLTEEFKKVKAVYDGAMKPLIEDNVYTLNCIRTTFVEVKQQVYLIANFEEGMMGYYDKEGSLVTSRVLEPHERQHRIK